MQKWEYEVYAHTHSLEDPHLDNMIETLNGYGEKG